MVIVSDNTATDILFEKVGGPVPVNALMQSYGLNTIQANGTRTQAARSASPP